MNFQQHLQAQGMFNNYPHQTFQPAPYLRRNAAQTSPFVSYPPPHHHGIMANTSAQPTFFADEMYYHRDEQALLDEMMHQPPVQQPPVTNFGFRPLLPSAPGPVPATAVPSAPVWKTESIAPLVAPGVLDSHVDNAQYAPVFDHDWNRASIDYDASSPESVDTDSTSPLTPATDGSGSFTELFFSNYHHHQLPNNTVAAAFAAKQYNVPYNAIMHPGALPFAFTAPPLPPYQPPAGFGPTPAPVSHNGFLSPAALIMQSGPSDRAHNESTSSQHHHALPLRPAAPSFQRDDFADALSNIEHNSESEDGIVSPGESEDRGSTSSRRSSSSSMADEPNQQPDRDEYLLRMRRRGISYKEIKRLGGFREAESTLRGRWRVLTKDKHERVRKPEWTANDEALLLQAVAETTRNPRGGVAPKVNSRKVPWKVVSRRIKERGGTYLFAPATCAKKWDALENV